jgi:Lrp/AsnC family transcriptional regulator for asnA, asnC and gidA
MDIDRVSQQIITILQRDGRRPNTVIAREIGVSEALVRARIQALTSSGILQIIGLTDPGNMGFGVMALIGVQASNDLNRIAELVSTWRETTYVVISAGSFDLLIELVCTDNNDLLRVVERLRAVDGVRSTETFIYISRHKLNYAYAADRPSGGGEDDVEDDPRPRTHDVATVGGRGAGQGPVDVDDQ